VIIRLKYFANNFMADWPRLSSFYRPQHHGSAPKGTPEILAGIRVRYGKGGFRRTKAVISLKRGKIGP